EMDAVTIPSTWKTRLNPPPLTVTPAAGPVIASVPVVSLSSSWPPVRLIVLAVLNTVLSKTIDWSPPLAFARAIAWRRSVRPTTGVSVGLLTTIAGDGTQRSSNASRAGRTRWGAWRIVRGTGRANNRGLQERFIMGNSYNRMEKPNAHGRNT